MTFPCRVEVAVQGSKFEERSDLLFGESTKTTADLRHLEVLVVMLTSVSNEVLDVDIHLIESDGGDVVAFRGQGIASSCGAFSYAILSALVDSSKACCTSSVDARAIGTETRTP